jgi:hypothetical protein
MSMEPSARTGPSTVSVATALLVGLAAVHAVSGVLNLS